MQQLDLGEDLASELGTDLEYNQRVLERAIKDTQGELDALVNIPPGKEVKVGQKVPRRGLSEEQQQQLKQLNKRMEALQKSLAQNQASLDDIGLFAAKGVDTTTEDLFAPTAEQGVIFETPEQFLGSSKYGKIAKLRKDLNRLVNIMPVRFEDLQKARTDYVTALGVGKITQDDLKPRSLITTASCPASIRFKQTRCVKRRLKVEPLLGNK
jgi:hypothetical protein